MITANQEANVRVFEKKCVVFLDILGFRELVKSAKDNSEIAQSVEDSLEKIKKLGNAKAQTVTSADVTIFSDSVVISVNKDIQCIRELIERLSIMMWSLMCDGVFMRGGLTIGLLSRTSHRPWGPAFIDAYDTETSLAVHPRIVFSKEACEWISQATNMSELPVKRDEKDGVYYIDVIGSGMKRITATELEPEEIAEATDFRQIAKHLKDGRSSAIANPAVFRKYSWLCKEWDNAMSRLQPMLKISLEPYYTDARQQAESDLHIGI